MSDVDEELLVRARERVGQTLCGKYRIEDVLGVGGMAFVYVAVHRNGHRVALKMLHPELTLRSDIRQRFLQEGRAANAVRHRGVVTVSDDDTTADGAAFIVMELLDGKSIEELWDDLGRRLPTKLVLALARDLCDILDEAHRAGVVHRDLKPANLFLTKDGVLKVLDFGLAQLRDTARPKLTATGVVFGTPAFMAPEQAQGRTRLLDAKTDLFAVGATMFTLLSGRLVHEGESAQEIVMRTATEPAPSLVTMIPHAHEALIALVDRALAFDKSDRFETARAMRGAVLETIRTMYGKEKIELRLPESRGPASQSRTDIYVPPQPTVAAVAAENEQAVQAAIPPTIVDSDSDKEPTRRVLRERARHLWTRHVKTAALALGVLLVVTGASVVGKLSRATDASTGGEPLIESPLAATVVAPTFGAPSAEVAIAPSIDAPESVSTEVGPDSSPQVPPAPTTSSLPPAPLPRAAGPRVRAPATAPHASSKPTAPSLPPSCHPPYVRDATGEKRWKLECL